MRCPHCARIINNRISEKSRAERKHLLLNCLDEYNTITLLFNSVKIKGVRFTRKTLERDLKTLEETGRIKLKKKKKKTGGYINEITKID